MRVLPQMIFMAPRRMMESPMVRKISTRWLWDRDGRMPSHLHQNGHQGDPEHRGEQGRGHGEAGGDQGAVEDHAPQGDEIHLGEVDDPHGIVHHPEAQGHQGVDGPSGQTGEDELDQVVEAAHVSFPGAGAAPGLRPRTGLNIVTLSEWRLVWQGKRR